MVARLPSLEMRFGFQDRVYALGEAIETNCRLDIARDVVITEGRVDLVCEETWTEFFTISVPVSGGAPRLRGEAYLRSPTRLKRITEIQQDSSTHSTVTFLKMEELSRTTVNSYYPLLRIGTNEPSHATIGAVHWKLMVTIVTDSDGQFRASRDVTVTLT